MKALSITMLAAGLFIASCSKTETTEPYGNTQDGMRVTQVWASGNVDGTMQTYYNAQLRELSYRKYSPEGSLTALQQGVANSIYRYNGSIANATSHDNTAFTPVLSADPHDATLYREVIIVFNEGHAPQQFLKAETILDAAQGHDPAVTLIPVQTVYRISPMSMQPHVSASRD